MAREETTVAQRAITRLTEQLNTAETGRYETMAELQRVYEVLTELMPQVGEMRRRMETILARVGEVTTAWTTTEAMFLRLRTDMADRDRRMAAWYLDRRDVETLVRFAARCATRAMIHAAFAAMNAAAAQLDESMGEIVGGQEVPGLTNNAAFEAYEEDVPLQAPRSPWEIFAHERNALRQIVVDDPFEDFPTVVLSHRVEGTAQDGGWDRRDDAGHAGDAGGNDGEKVPRSDDGGGE